MAGPNVTISMSAADAGLVAKWQEARRAGPDAYEKSLSKVKASSRTLKSELDSMIGGAIARYATLEFAISKVGDVTRKVIELQVQLNSIRDTAATSQEEALARFTNQGQLSGLSQAQLKALGTQTASQAARYGIAPGQGIDLGRELLSQGVSAGNVPQFLEEALKFSSAQGSQLDMDTLKAFIAQTRANDDTLSAKAAAETAKTFFGAFLGRQIQPQQLEPFSKVNVGLKAAGLSNAEQIAFNTASLDLYGGDASQAATFDRAFVNKLRAPDKASKRALQQIVGNTDSVDFIGENMGDVLDRLAKGLEKIDERRRVPLLTQIFGQEYGAQAAGMIERRGNYKSILGDIGTAGEKFDSSAQSMLGTNAAQQRRLAAEREQLQGINGIAGAKTVGEAMATQLERRKGTGLEGYLSSTIYETGRFVAGGDTKENARLAGAASAGVESLFGSLGSYLGNIVTSGGLAMRAASGEAGQQRTIEILSEISSKLDDKGVVIEGDETTNAKRRGTPAKAPLTGVGGR